MRSSSGFRAAATGFRAPSRTRSIMLCSASWPGMPSAKRSAMNAPEARVVLRAQDVGMTFNPDTSSPVNAIADIGFELHRGEVVAIVGPSGCGKTTLFNIIAGLLEPSHGRVEVNGQRVHQA